jgi:hypothetical protein
VHGPADAGAVAVGVLGDLWLLRRVCQVGLGGAHGV